MSERTSNPGFLSRSDVRKCRSIVGDTSGINLGQVSDDLVLRIISDMVPSNMQCNAIGLQPTFASAMETVDILGMRLISTDGIDLFFEKMGWPRTQRANSSTQFVTRTSISRTAVELIFNKLSEDLKFANWARRFWS